MITVKLGQPVKIVTGYKTAAVSGTVTKIGRVWIEVTPDGWGRALRFRLDDQTDGSRVGVSPHFYTLEQWAEKQRRDEAGKFLREQGISVDFGSPWRGRETELAALIRPPATPSSTPSTTTEEG